MEKWIKSKVAVVTGINNQFACICIVENQQQILKLKEKFDFPYLVELYDEIPTIDEVLK